jgi:hypothetical protein
MAFKRRPFSAGLSADAHYSLKPLGSYGSAAQLDSGPGELSTHR